MGGRGRFGPHRKIPLLKRHNCALAFRIGGRLGGVSALGIPPPIPGGNREGILIVFEIGPGLNSRVKCLGCVRVRVKFVRGLGLALGF